MTSYTVPCLVFIEDASMNTIIDHYKPSVSQQLKQRLDSTTISKFTVYS